jgi:hypothetical protein
MSINSNKAIAIRMSLDSRQFLSGLNRNKSALSKFATNVTSMSKTIVSSLGLIGGYMAKNMIQEFASFEFEMAKVAATTGSTGAELRKLVDNAKLLGKTTQFTALQVADLQFKLAKLGFKNDQILGMTDQILQLSLALGEDLGETAKLVAGTMRIFGKDSEQTEDIVNQMATAFTSSGLALDTYGESLKYIGPIANAAGSNITEMAAYLGILANSTIEASIAGTSMRKMFSLAAVAGRPLKSMLNDIRDATDQTRKAEELFGLTAMTSAVVIANSEKELSVLNQTIADNQGQVKAMASLMDSTAKGTLVRLSSAFNALSIEVGDQLFYFLKPLIEEFTSFVTTIDTRVISAIFTLVGALVGTAGLVIAISTTYNMLKMVVIALKLFSVGVYQTSVKIAKSVGAMIISMGPIGIVIATIVAVIVGIGAALASNNVVVKKYTLAMINSFISLYNESLPFRKSINLMVFAFDALWQSIKAIGIGGARVFKHLALAMMKMAMGDFSGAWDSLGDSIIEPLKKFFKETDEWAANVTNPFDKIDKIDLWSEKDLNKKIDNTKNKLIDFAKDIKNTIGKTYNEFLNLFNGGSSILRGEIEGMPQRTKKDPILDMTVRGVTPTPGKKDNTQNATEKFLTKWSVAIQAVQDIFASMFEFINVGYENQLIDIAKKADMAVDLAGREHLSEADKAAKIKKIREKQAKDEARIKLKMWKADKAAAISSIIINGAIAISKAFAMSGLGGLITGPLVAASVGAQLAVAVGSKPPKFAKGGIVSGRTLAEVGEYSGVRSNPEVIAPLDKLKKLIGGSGSDIYITGEFRQKGSDLIAVIDQTKTRRNRY